MGVEGVGPPQASRPCVQDHRCRKGTAESSRGQPHGIIGILSPHLLHLIDPRSGLRVIFASAAPGSMLRLLAHLSSEASLGRRGAVICFQTSGRLLHRDLARLLVPSVLEEAPAYPPSVKSRRGSVAPPQGSLPGPKSQTLLCSFRSQALIYTSPPSPCCCSIHLFTRWFTPPRDACPSSGQAVPAVAPNTCVCC